MSVDWSRHDGRPEDECQCRCGCVFPSHTAMVLDRSLKLHVRKPCPACGKDDVRRVSSAPEKFTVTREEAT